MALQLFLERIRLDADELRCQGVRDEVVLHRSDEQHGRQPGVEVSPAPADFPKQFREFLDHESHRRRELGERTFPASDELAMCDSQELSVVGKMVNAKIDESRQPIGRRSRPFEYGDEIRSALSHLRFQDGREKPLLGTEVMADEAEVAAGTRSNLPRRRRLETFLAEQRTADGQEAVTCITSTFCPHA